GKLHIALEAYLGRRDVRSSARRRLAMLAAAGHETRHQQHADGDSNFGRPAKMAVSHPPTHIPKRWVSDPLTRSWARIGIPGDPVHFAPQKDQFGPWG